jgi:hypothetical protein
VSLEEAMARMVAGRDHRPDQRHRPAARQRYARECVSEKEIADTFATVGRRNSDESDVSRIEEWLLGA